MDFSKDYPFDNQSAFIIGKWHIENKNREG